jgi:hypothetical protein
MTSRPTFGDFLQLARQDLDPGAQPPGTIPREHLAEVISSLGRLIAVLRRYTQDLTASPGITPRAHRVLSPLAEACFQADETLARAARFLAFRNAPPRLGVVRHSSAQARRLERVTASLRMGRDLLHTHFSVDANGRRWPRSEWALVITSEAVTGAFLTEIAQVARQAADQCSALALPASAKVSGDDQARRRLNTACQWLWVLEASARAASQHALADDTERELLSAIPVNILPPRRVLRGGEPVAVLCEGAINSAERVRHLAWMAADRTTASRDVTIASLRQVAENGTVTSNNCAGLLDVLAIRMAQAGHREASDQLASAAAAARRACDTWLNASQEVTRIKTAPPGQLSATAIEAAELTSWTGRLAYADPLWLPSDGPDRPFRAPETLAMEDLPLAVAAAHHACETLTGLACVEQDEIWAAATAGRILVPTRPLPHEHDIPYPFAPAPRERVELLLMRYAEAARSSRRAADMVGGVAARIKAPSRTLALARSAVTDRSPDITSIDRPHPAETGGDKAAGRVPGPVETTLLDLGVTDPALLTRGAQVDRDAERLIIEATAATETSQRPHRPNRLNRPAGTAALVNHALTSGDPRAVALLRQPTRAQREPPEREP